MIPVLSVSDGFVRVSRAVNELPVLIITDTDIGTVFACGTRPGCERNAGALAETVCRLSDQGCSLRSVDREPAQLGRRSRGGHISFQWLRTRRARSLGVAIRMNEMIVGGPDRE